MIHEAKCIFILNNCFMICVFFTYLTVNLLNCTEEEFFALLSFIDYILYVVSKFNAFLTIFSEILKFTFVKIIHIFFKTLYLLLLNFTFSITHAFQFVFEVKHFYAVLHSFSR